MTDRNPQEKAMRAFAIWLLIGLFAALTAVVLGAWVVYWIVKG